MLVYGLFGNHLAEEFLFRLAAAFDSTKNISYSVGQACNGDLGCLAAMHGYDAYKVKWEGYCVVLNRGKMILYNQGFEDYDNELDKRGV